MVSVLYPETVTVLGGGGRDVQTGDPLPDGSQTVVPGCVVWPQLDGNEQTFQRDTVPTGYSVLLPPGTAIAATDRVRLYGQVWDVTGEPAVWSSPLTGTQPGVQVVLRRTRG